MTELDLAWGGGPGLKDIRVFSPEEVLRHAADADLWSEGPQSPAASAEQRARAYVFLCWWRTVPLASKKVVNKLSPSQLVELGFLVREHVAGSTWPHWQAVASHAREIAPAVLQRTEGTAA